VEKKGNMFRTEKKERMRIYPKEYATHSHETESFVDFRDKFQRIVKISGVNLTYFQSLIPAYQVRLVISLYQIIAFSFASTFAQGMLIKAPVGNNKDMTT
jgi:hypothetical protein